MAMAEVLSDFQVLMHKQVAALSAAFSAELRKVQRGLSERFNQTARRLRAAETRTEWRAVLTEAASAFSVKSGVFWFSDPGVKDAPAFQEAIESRDTVVTARNSAQLSAPVMETLGESPAPRCYLFPVVEGDKVIAVLYAEPGDTPLDRDALELLVSIAAGSLPQPAPLQTMGLIQIAGAPMSRARLAVRAQAERFARVRVAEMVLNYPRQLKKGRQDRTLYVQFKEQIHAGREEFRKKYLLSNSSMADYFHQELVHTLAKDDATTLGSEYPGALR
ncbi:MAG TPA: hypothetical protein VM120_20655 [Bryobacteraceae bacterium]|nr:hypothetical protein [Bryobacteraceae bacterium]